MAKKPNKDLIVKQKDLYTLVTVGNEKFMVWKDGAKDPRVNLNIGSYTEFSFLDDDVDGMIKFLEWYKEHKYEVKIVVAEKRVNIYNRNDDI